MVPEMSGGIFWEHLHRLVAGGLLLMFALATWYAWRETADRPWIFRASVAGLGLLLVQAVFGGLTVLLRLPTAVSTAHLMLALAFLALAVVLATTTSPRRHQRVAPTPATGQILRAWGGSAAGVIFVQSLVGGMVRHADAGMACPDVPLCLGRWIPPLTNHLVALHFTHRVLAVAATMLTTILVVRLLSRAVQPHVRRMAWLVAGLLTAQMVVGVVSVTTLLAVLPVSLHTLGGASLLAALVTLTTWGFLGGEAAGTVALAADAPGAAGTAGAPEAAPVGRP
jgi:cytochrome c oxidase assembly protein subunit 15